MSKSSDDTKYRKEAPKLMEKYRYRDIYTKDGYQVSIETDWERDLHHFVRSTDVVDVKELEDALILSLLGDWRGHGIKVDMEMPEGTIDLDELFDYKVHYDAVRLLVP